MTYVIVGLYLLFMLGLGLYGRRTAQRTPDDYFLAGRRIGPVVLFFTLIATNFSAFFFLGFAGAGYRVGYSYYPIMAFGTALVGLAFYFIGHRVWALGKQRGYITPPEMVGDRFRSRPLKMVFLAVMVWFTIPYLAIQPIGAGYLLSELTGGAIPFFGGAVILTVCMVVYVFAGGMRSVAITDVVQGVMMFVLMVLAVAVVANAVGGLADANARVYEAEPALFSREGGGGFFTPRRWFSYMVLWILAVPMFPQVFMRFFIPKSARSLKVAAMLYPVVTAVLFLLPIVIGVIAHIPYPDLAGAESDQVLPMILADVAPRWVTALIMVGALAAFMSTMDSQLLALSSMLTRDLYVEFSPGEVPVDKQVAVGRLLVVVLALVGLGVALRPPQTLFEIATEAFTGLAVLFPTTIACLYWRRATAASCIASIAIGQLMLLGFHYDVIPEGWAVGFLPVVPIVVVCFLVIGVGSWGRRVRGRIY